MRILLNPFKSLLCVLSLIAFLLLFTPVLIANEPATEKSVGWVERSETQQSNPQSETCGEQSRTIQNPQLDNASFALKTAKLHMPFIANNGQMDGQVKFYAKTFGGTMFVTKEGEIVYALPMNSTECRGEWHSPNGIHDEEGMLHDHHISNIVHPASWIVDHDKPEFQNPKSAIKNDAVCHPECNEGSTALKRDSSPSAQHDREEPAIVRLSLRQAQDVVPCMVSLSNHHDEVQNPKHVASGVEPSATCGEQSRTIQNQKSGVALREEFVGAKIKAIQGVEPSVTKVSYFKGNDPSKWKKNISTYDAVNLGEIYDGIELRLRAYGNNLEKLFCVKPGADPEQIKIRLSGLKDCGVQKAEITHPLVPSREGINPKSDASTSLSMTSFQAESRNQNPKIQINKSGELVAETELGSVKFTKPVAYQEIEGKRVYVDCGYLIADCGLKKSEMQNPNSEVPNPKSEYGFKVASYDKSKPLIIDPLLASTYLGGSSDEYGYSITLDTSGNVYVTGDTWSTNFPTTSGTYDSSQNGINDVFVSKLDSGLTSLLASTYLGGSDNDEGHSLTLDTSGNVYVTGWTSSSDFPTTSGAHDTSYNAGEGDVFVSKLDGGLTTLLASTYLGGSRSDFGRSLALDTSGNVYVTGSTYSADFPTTSDAYDTSFNGDVLMDVFVSKLDSGLTSLLASTYLGGFPHDEGYSLALDTSGNVYVTGWTSSTNFPTTSGTYDSSQNGINDVFVSKLDSGLTSLLASTYLGGSSYDYGNALALDTSGNVYVTGYTVSTDFPTTNGAYDTSFNSIFSDIPDVFVSKLNGGLTRLLASTYLGGSSYDYGNALALDTSRNVYVTGITNSEDFPTTSGAYDTSFGVYSDVFISRLDSGLSSLLASTYLGGSDNDEGHSLTLDTSGNVYVTGNTSSTDFPTTSGAYDTSFGGGSDVFISRLDSNLSALNDTLTPTETPTETPTATATATPSACSGAIVGQVTDATTGNPIVGARVAYGIGTSRQNRTIIGRTTTNVQGAYAFQGVECGNYVVIVDANGYRRSRRTNVAQVSVEGGIPDQTNFELQPRVTTR